MKDLIIHPRIHERHPEISSADVKSAFNNIFAQAYRVEKDAEEYMAIGSDLRGRLLEMVYRVNSDGMAIVYHAFTPPTKKALEELDLNERKQHGKRRNK